VYAFFYWVNVLLLGRRAGQARLQDGSSLQRRLAARRHRSHHPRLQHVATGRARHRMSNPAQLVLGPTLHGGREERRETAVGARAVPDVRRTAISGS